jgi:steroid delta-isomerase-like uncharacterized protein
MVLASLAHAEDSRTQEATVLLWYEAFNTKNPALFDTILASTWQDIPAMPDSPTGPDGAKRAMQALSMVFPDLKATPAEILQAGKKVIVRSEITGTQAAAFFGHATAGKSIAIQAVDIHEFKDGKIIKTWHTEDWMTGFRQLGVFGQ